MRIVLNGNSCEITAKTIDEILLDQGYENLAIATALNGTFIHKHDRADTELKEGDRLEVIAPIRGG